MNSIQINISPRTTFGKKTKALRKEGIIPGEIFGHGFANEHVSVSAKEFEHVYKKAGQNTVISLVKNSGEKIPALITGLHRDTIKNEIMSVDFYHVRKDEKIKTKIPIEYTGEEIVAKTGYLLVKVLDEIEIEALPDKIPHSFTVDVSNLSQIGQNISISDLTVPEEVKILIAKDAIIATVTEKEEEIPEPPKEEAPTEQEEKKEAEGEEKKEE